MKKAKRGKGLIPCVTCVMPNIILLYLFTGSEGVSQVFNVVNDVNHFTL